MTGRNVRSVGRVDLVQSHTAHQFVAVANPKHGETSTRCATQDLQILWKAEDTPVGRFGNQIGPLVEFCLWYRLNGYICPQRMPPLHWCKKTGQIQRENEVFLFYSFVHTA